MFDPALGLRGKLRITGEQLMVSFNDSVSHNESISKHMTRLLPDWKVQESCTLCPSLISYDVVVQSINFQWFAPALRGYK